MNMQGVHHDEAAAEEVQTQLACESKDETVFKSGARAAGGSREPDACK